MHQAHQPHVVPQLHYNTAVERMCAMINKQKQKKRSDITPDPGGHRPQRPCAQGRTCAKQEQAQVTSPGQTQNNEHHVMCSPSSDSNQQSPRVHARPAAALLASMARSACTSRAQGKASKGPHLDSPGQPSLDYSWHDQADDRHAGPELGDRSGGVPRVSDDQEQSCPARCGEVDSSGRSDLQRRDASV